MALLAAVAAQAATALENGRLYRQLQGQGGRARADARVQREHPRVAERRPRGRRIATIAIVRWNRRWKSSTACATRQAVARRLDELFEPGFLDVLRAARRESPEGTALYRVPLVDAARRRRAGCSSTSRPRRSATRDGGDRRQHHHHRGHLDARAARGAAADLREDGVDRAARRRRGARGEHAADRHLELHADAAARAPSRTIRGRKVLEKIERQTFRAAKIVNGLLNLARPAQVDSGPVRHQRRHQRRAVAARAPVPHRQHPGAQGARRARRSSCRASSTSCSRCS